MGWGAHHSAWPLAPSVLKMGLSSGALVAAEAGRRDRAPRRAPAAAQPLLGAAQPRLAGAPVLPQRLGLLVGLRREPRRQDPQHRGLLDGRSAPSRATDSQPGSSDTQAAGSPILHPEGWGRGESSRTKHRNLLDKPKYRIVNLQVEFSTHVGVSTFPS